MKEDLLKLKSSFDTKKDIVNILVEMVRFLIVYLWSKLFHESSVAVVGEFDYENTPVFFVRFSEFVIKLNESGYELDGVHSFGDICEKISFDESAVGEISVQFEKENVPQK